jgi:hypothetical protein
MEIQEETAMAHGSARSDPSGSRAAIQLPGHFLNLGEAQSEAILGMQKELLQAYEQISRAWLERVKLEVDLWSDLAAKMSASASVPGALSAFQQSVARRIQMAADDGQQLFEDSQKIINTVTRAISNGGPTAASGTPRDIAR